MLTSKRTRPVGYASLCALTKELYDMPKPFADDAQRDAWLATPRLAILMMNREAPAPVGVPVWYEWNGSTLEMFADASSPKVRRLERDLAQALDVDLVGPVAHDLADVLVTQQAIDRAVAEDVVGDVLDELRLVGG